MTPQETAARVLDLVPAGFDCEVVVTSGRNALTRFANSFIHQNMADDTTSLSLTLVWEGRVSTSSGTASPETLASFVERAAEAARIAPVNPEWPGVTDPIDVPPSLPVPDSIASASPADRAELVSDFVHAGEGMRAAGYCSTASATFVYANSKGHIASGQTASAVLDGIQQTPTSAGSGHAAARDLEAIDAHSVGSIAADRARRSESSIQIDPAEYEVVLAPEAVATLALFLGVYGFNGKAVNEGQSFLKIGDRQFDPAFELVDDGLDDRSMKLRFDSEGTPKRRLALIEDGVTRNVVYDRREAAKAETESTGHAIKLFGQNIGPVPTDLFVTPGASSPEDLIAGVRRGLYVSVFNYVRILDPRTTVATGLTRNGTFLIEDGELTDGVSDLRFTQSFAGSIAPGRVLGVGNDARFADSEFGPTIAHVPSIRLAGWRFTGGAAG
jgi:predicted Zn-dependent protease